MRYDTANKLTPLQLHQVLPTLSTSERYYRTAATSPFQGLQPDTSIVTSNATNTIFSLKPISAVPRSDYTLAGTCLSVGSANSSVSPGTQETARFCKDDYDSDDELKRVDIAYSMDGGKLYIYLPDKKICKSCRVFF